MENLPIEMFRKIDSKMKMIDSKMSKIRQVKSRILGIKTVINTLVKRLT